GCLAMPRRMSRRTREFRLPPPLRRRAGVGGPTDRPAPPTLRPSRPPTLTLPPKGGGDQNAPRRPAQQRREGPGWGGLPPPPPTAGPIAGDPAPHPPSTAPATRRILATGFIGRRTELHEVRRRIRRGDRVFVLQGLGGLGKTTLAFHMLPLLGPADAPRLIL